MKRRSRRSINTKHFQLIDSSSTTEEDDRDDESFNPISSSENDSSHIIAPENEKNPAPYSDSSESNKSTSYGIETPNTLSKSTSKHKNDKTKMMKGRSSRGVKTKQVEFMNSSSSIEDDCNDDSFNPTFSLENESPDDIEPDNEPEPTDPHSEDDDDGDAVLNKESSSTSINNSTSHDTETPNTLSKSKTKGNKSLPKMDRKKVVETLMKSHNPFKSSISSLHDMYSGLHKYWLTQINQGYNILLYGYGSKMKVIEEFHTASLSDEYCLTVNGFFPGLKFKQILNEINENVLPSDPTRKKGRNRSVLHQCESICRSLCFNEDAPGDLYLIIHNIDGEALRDSHTALSLLAECSQIHIIASIDHLNAPLLWDEVTLTRYNWAWHDTTTFEPYIKETSYENSILVQQSGSLAMNSLTHVLQSLPERAQKIFELLATHYLEHKDDTDPPYTGQSFTELYRKCREQFLSNSDAALRAQLTEFLDHKLIKSCKTSDGTETLMVLVDETILKQFLDHEDEDST